MLFFSKRTELYRRFLEWAIENNAAKTGENLIAFLYIKGLIDEDMVMDYLRTEGKDA